MIPTGVRIWYSYKLAPHPGGANQSDHRRIPNLKTTATPCQGLPHSRDCFVCGEENPEGFRLKFEVDENSHVLLRFRARKTMQGYGHIMHGGLQATLLDETLGWAAAIPVRRMHVAAELNVRYLQETPLETDLVVEAWCVKSTSRMSIAEGVIRDMEGKVYTRARGKFVPISQEENEFVNAHLIYHEGDLRIFEDELIPVAR